MCAVSISQPVVAHQISGRFDIGGLDVSATFFMHYIKLISYLTIFVFN